MKGLLKGFTVMLLSCSLLTAAYARLAPGTWQGNGLIAEIQLESDWRNGVLVLSATEVRKINAFTDDLTQLNKLQFRVPVQLLITVNVINEKSETVLMASEQLGYFIVLRFHPKDDHFEVVWFDRHDKEIPNDNNLLHK